jgi:hypothetical protein
MDPFRAENDHLTDTLVLEWLLIIQIKVIKYLSRPEILLYENSSSKYE